MTAGTANFGISEDAQEKNTTGPLASFIIDHALRCYLQPRPFQDALARLDESNIVILTGPQGAGKNASALALLQEVGADSIQRMSPAQTLAELSRAIAATDEVGRGYVVQDRLPEDAAPEIIQHSVHELSGALSDAGSCMVITTTYAISADALQRIAVPWESPDLSGLLGHACQVLLEVGPSDEDLAKLAVCAEQCTTAFEIVRLVERYDEGGIEAAVEWRERDVRRAVVDWLERKPGSSELLPIVALAFVHRFPLRVFETELARLQETLAPAANPDKANREIDAFEQTRGSNFAIGELVVVRMSPGNLQGEPRERRVSFLRDGYRQSVLGELWKLYGPHFWDRIYDWLRDVVAQGDEEIAVEVARGIAMLVEEGRGDIEETLLVPWASGTSSCQVTAVYVLWWMCTSDSLATEALRLAVTWANGENVRRRFTAALAFVGELGMRYPTEAERALWLMSKSDDAAGYAARDSYAGLFSTLVEGQQKGSIMAARLARRLDLLSRSSSTAREFRRASDVTLRLLQVGSHGGLRPSVVTFLQQQPSKVGVIGRLWTEALVSRPHRAKAMEALKIALRAFEAEPESEALIRPLVGAIVEHLPEDELAPLGQLLVVSLGSASGVAPSRLQTVAGVLGDALEKRDRKKNK